VKGEQEKKKIQESYF